MDAPRNTRPVFTYIGEGTVRDADGAFHDVMEAMEQLPWTRQWCPFMPHEYAILGKSPDDSWFILDAMIRVSPKSYRAFFRGYERSNRYWEA